jgi:hypothetical protein
MNLLWWLPTKPSARRIALGRDHCSEDRRHHAQIAFRPYVYGAPDEPDAGVFERIA